MERYALANKASALGAQTSVAVPGSVLEDPGVLRSYQAAVSTGGGATVDIEASNDNKSWLTLATITLTAADPSDGFSSAVPWLYTRANITAISSGTVDANMAIWSKSK